MFDGKNKTTKSEIRINASVLKSRSKHTQKKRLKKKKGTKKNAVYCDKTQHANYRGKPLFQATFKQPLNGEKLDVVHLFAFELFCYVVLVYSFGKNYTLISDEISIPADNNYNIIGNVRTLLTISSLSVVA